MTIEDMLRDAVAPCEGSAPAAAERARREALAALSRGRRRYRVRRVVAAGAAAAGVAAIAGFFVFAMPRGEGDRPATRSSWHLSVFDRPEQPVDRLAADAVPNDVRGTIRRMRLAGAGERLRFHVAETSNPARICIVATARSAAVSRGAACNEPAVLTRVGVLTFERGRQQTGPDGRSVSDQAFLVPDGIDRVIADGRRLTVRGNLATGTGVLGTGRTLVLVGPAATTITPDAGPDWPRSTVDGLPAVTVPLSFASATSPFTAPADVRLVLPAAAPAGSVVDLRVAGPDGLLGENVSYGTDASFELRYPAGWRQQWQLVFPLPDSPSVPDPRPVGPGERATRGIGFVGSAPRPVRLPVVDPTPVVVRVSKPVVVTLGDGTIRDLTVSAEMELTAP